VGATSTEDAKAMLVLITDAEAHLQLLRYVIQG